MVVDDNRTARDILTQMLGQFGFYVEQAKDADEAIEMVQKASNETPFELVLMDWNMPGKDGVQAAREIQNNSQGYTPPTIIMVTAYGREEVTQAAEGIEIQALLTKPVTPSQMLDSILLAMGKEVVQQRNENKADKRAEDAIEKLAGANVLLVEDNQMNQELAIELLNMNHVEVTLAENGQEAIDILMSKGPTFFDGVLMDCQMPVLDGYKATRLIRQESAFKSLPILAMTANAMAGDKEKVLDAGMNDHIAKPISVTDMFITMARWITPANPVNATANKRHEDDGIIIGELPGIDVSRGLSTTQNNKSLYLKLLARFKQSNQGFHEEFMAALNEADQETAVRLAHTLKGTSGNIGATDVYALSAKLETEAKSSLEGLDGLVSEVVNSWQKS